MTEKIQPDPEKLTYKDTFKFMKRYDWAVIVYMMYLAVLLIFFHNEFETWYLTSLIHTGISIAVTLLVYLHLKMPGNPLLKFIRTYYPVGGLVYFYTETSDLIFIIFEKNTWFDLQVIQFEQWLFGEEVTRMLEPYAYWWLNEIIIMGYLSYYFIVFGIPLYLYYKKHYVRLESLNFSFILITMFSYALFYLYPVEGPRWQTHYTYEQHPIEGFFFVKFVYWLMKTGAVHGGAMPSTHTALAILMMFHLRKAGHKKLYMIMYPFFIGLVVGTFWGRFHYISDTIAGAMIAYAAIYVDYFFFKRKDKHKVIGSTS